MSGATRTIRRAAASAATLALLGAALVTAAPSASSAPAVSPRGSVDGNWFQVGGGLSGTTDDTLSQVFQLTSREQFPDLRSTPGPIYAAGTFIASGSTTINRVAQIDGASWTTLPGDDTGIAPGAARGETGGLPTPGVYGMVLSGNAGTLFAGGNFWGSDDTLNNVGKWNGSDWRPMGFGLNDVVQDVVMGNDFIGMDDVNYADDTVYAVGSFAGPCDSLDCTGTLRAAAGVAQYSQADDSWYPLGNGTITGTAYTGAYIDDTLYVGGQFTDLGGKTVGSVARWSTVDDTWLPLGGGLSAGSVYAMAVHPITRDLYIGGYNLQIAGYGAGFSPGIVKWDYSDDTWAAVGSGFVNPDVDDIAFSQDGTTMWVALDSTPGAAPAGNVATLTNADFANPGVRTITGTWNGITSAGVSGVSGPAPSGTVNQTSARAAYAVGNNSVIFGGNFHTAGAITAGRVARWSPPLPPPPSIPPNPPTGVTATGAVGSVTVSWSAPAPNSFLPITNYRVTATPGGATCEVNALTCTFSDLTVGTSYTFQAQAYNFAGWSDLSAPSNAASPLAPPPPPVPVAVSIENPMRMVSGRGTEVMATVVTTGVDPGTPVVPWTRIGRGEWTPNAASTLVVAADGSAEWKRKFGANRNRLTISIKFEVVGVSSDVTSLRPVK